MIKRLLFATVAVAFIICLVDGARDASCKELQNGYCTYSSKCRSGYYYQYGLCSGSKRCCVRRGSGGDSPCTVRGGTCKSRSDCTGRMEYHTSGLCSGPRDRRCCLLQYKY